MDLYLTPWVKAAAFVISIRVEKDTGFPELWQLAIAPEYRLFPLPVGIKQSEGVPRAAIPLSPLKRG